jgi:hypothetical protein
MPSLPEENVTMEPPEESILLRKAAFANLFSDAVESFGLIHQNKKGWDLAQRLLLTRLGIQQGRLLAWGDALRICHPGYLMDPHFDNLPFYEDICQHLKTIRAHFQCENKQSYLDNYGLKPVKESSFNLESALHMTRLEAFRERYQNLDLQNSWTPQTHWIIVDNTKFPALIVTLQKEIGTLIDLTGMEKNVNQAMKRDIKALGWHPIFDRIKAANDGSKLQLIKEACGNEYPEYSAATKEPLAYLGKEWQDSYQEAMNKASHTFPSRPSPTNTASSENSVLQERLSRPNIFQKIRKSWSKPKSHSERSMSIPASNPSQEHQSGTRSKSTSAIS